MRTILGNSANVLASITEKETISPSLEVVLIYSEPEYGYDAGGLVRRRKVGDFRFAASPDELRRLADQFKELADAGEERVREAVENTVDTEPKQPGKKLSNDDVKDI